jgi:predicted DNA-binding WGR domain protein
MKTIQSTTLQYVQGNSNKTYEINLVELANLSKQRYLVNFRFGKTGTHLREGTKTTEAVEHAEAEKIYLSLLVSKVNKGYQITSGYQPDLPITQIPAVPLAVLEFSSLDTRRQLILQRLQVLVSAKRLDAKALHTLRRLVWRCGELALIEALPLLNYLVGKYQDDLLNCSLAWSLGRIGGEQAYLNLQTLTTSEVIQVQRLAKQALLAVATEAQRQILLADAEQQLPEDLKTLLAQSDVDAAQNLLSWFEQQRPLQAQSSKNRHPEAQLTLLYCYLIAYYQQPNYYSLLIQVADQISINLDNAWVWRVLFKMAEFQQDWLLLAHLIKRLEQTKPNYFDGSSAINAFLPETHAYFRRRSWRILRRLASLDQSKRAQEQYVDLAQQLLLLYVDGQDSATNKLRVKWQRIANRYQRIEWQLHYPTFATHVAFQKLLHANDTNYRFNAQQLIVDQLTRNKTPARTEAYPQIWDQHPEAVLHILQHSRCAEVHTVFLKTLAANTAFCERLSVNNYLNLALTPYANTALWALAKLKPLYPKLPEPLAFLTKLISANVSEVRQTAQQWLQALSDEALLQDSSWLSALLLSSHTDNRELARRYLNRLHQGAFQQALSLRLIAAIQALNAQTPQYNEIIQDVLWTFLNPLQATLTSLDLAVVRDLLAHPVPDIQWVGAEILAAKQLSPQQLPDDLFEQLLNADSEQARAIAVRLLAHLPDTELVQMADTLLLLLQHESVSMRAETSRLIANTAPRLPVLAADLLQGLIPVLFAAEAHEGVHETVVNCTTQSLQTAWPSIDHDLLWRLLQAQSKAAQQAATVMLQPRPATIYTVRQWARLGKHPSLKVREWAWQAYRDYPALIQQHMEDALRIVDTEWADTRRFALDYFAQLDSNAWTSERFIFLCDSVYEDVQYIGRTLLQRFFNEDQGSDYLLKLSQHPSRQVQLFASQFLNDYAANKPLIQNDLKFYFISVLSAVNQGRVSKDRVLKFLVQEALSNKQSAHLVADILSRQSVTIAVQDKERLLTALRDLQRVYPELAVPLTHKPRALRGFQTEAR